MENLINKTVNLDLTSINGNAFNLMGHFQKQARKENWTQKEIDQVIDECRSGDYDHLVQTLIQYCEQKKVQVMENYKRYLGDGAYIEFDGYHIVLTTNNGITTTNTIALEPEVFHALVDYEKKLKQLLIDNKSHGQ